MQTPLSHAWKAKEASRGIQSHQICLNYKRLILSNVNILGINYNQFL